MGIHPYLVYIFAIPVFIVLSKLLFLKTEEAEWIYVFIGLSLNYKLCGRDRHEQLQSFFRKRDSLKVRILECLLVQFPFLTYLLYETRFYSAVVLVFISFLLALYTKGSILNLAIPTPFKRMPFEFIVGFRNTLLILLGEIILLAKAIQIGNFYLGLFCLGSSFLVYCSYYFEPEKSYFVWIYDKSINQFLQHKITFGIIGGLTLSLPLFIAILIVFPAEWFLISAVEVIGLIVLMTMILAKYSAFPSQMNIPQAILFILSLFFPFLLVFAIPIFYFQAKRKLSTVLR